MKKLCLTILSVFLIFVFISTVSAGYSGYYYPSRSYNYPSSDYKSEVTHEERVSYTNNYDWGREKVTSYLKEQKTIERTFDGAYRNIGYNYQGGYYRPYQYGPMYKAPTVSYTNWRYKPLYDSNVYVNDYYYKPMFDYNLGYYNWRY